MKHLLRISLIALLLSGFVTEVFAQVSRLDPHRYDQKLKEIQSPQLVDVRTQQEFVQGHLPNARLIDYHSDDFKDRLSKLDKSKPVFVYCLAGSRSKAAVNVLSALGFKEIYDLQGGIQAWQKASKPVVK
jgi:thioredoxin 1